MCKELKLIIEADGYAHLIPEIIIKDKIRQKNLEDAGFTVIRFMDSEILHNIGCVRDRIENEIKRLEEEFSKKAGERLPPTPSRGG